MSPKVILGPVAVVPAHGSDSLSGHVSLSMMVSWEISTKSMQLVLAELNSVHK